MKNDFLRQFDLSERLEGGRWANAEREDHQALGGRNGLKPEGEDGNKRHLQWGGYSLGSRRMRRDTDRAFGRLGAIGVVVGGKSQ